MGMSLACTATYGQKEKVVSGILLKKQKKQESLKHPPVNDIQQLV